MIHSTRSILVLGVLAIMATPAWAQTSSPIQNGQVDILKSSPRTASGVRLEDGSDRGSSRTDDRGGRGGSENSGPGSVNSGHGSANSGPGSLHSGSGRDGDMRQEDQREDRRVHIEGESRGLDRADRVAGEHGRDGRDNARAVQMDRPDYPERHERPDRSERHERERRD